MDTRAFVKMLGEANVRAMKARTAVSNLTLEQGPTVKQPFQSKRSLYLNNNILSALRTIAQPLASSYVQIAADFEDETRISWAGTAHEIRELLRKILEHLAPSIEVEQQEWYKLEPHTSGPTQKQRVKYILLKQGGDSRQQKVAQDIEVIEARTGALVRDVYGRASDAAHRSKNKTEAFKLLRYFEAFAYDLLDISE